MGQSANNTNITQQITSKLLLHAGKALLRKGKQIFILQVTHNTTSNTTQQAGLLKQ
jgi:uncharacterized protein YaaW (UPF0174 family)